MANQVAFVPGQVGTGSGTVTGTTGITVSLTGITAHDLLVVFCQVNAGSQVFTVTDGVNTYTSAGTAQNNDGNTSMTQIFYAKNCASGSVTVTVKTASGSSQTINACICEYSGADLSFPLDSTAQGTGIAGGIAAIIAPYSCPVNNAGDMVVGAITAGAGSLSAANGLRVRDNVAGFNAGDIPATVSTAPSWSVPANSHYGVVTASFRPFDLGTGYFLDNRYDPPILANRMRLIEGGAFMQLAAWPNNPTVTPGVWLDQHSPDPLPLQTLRTAKIWDYHQQASITENVADSPLHSAFIQHPGPPPLPTLRTEQLWDYGPQTTAGPTPAPRLDSWFGSQNEFLRKQLPRLWGEEFLLLNSLLMPDLLPQLRWHVQHREPVPIYRPVIPTQAFPLAPLNVYQGFDAWIYQDTTPRRPEPKIIPVPFSFSVAPIFPGVGWFGECPDPLRIPPRAVHGQGATVLEPTAVLMPSLAWLDNQMTVPAPVRTLAATLPDGVDVTWLAAIGVGTVVVKGPFLMTAGEIFVAGAVAGDIWGD